MTLAGLVDTAGVVLLWSLPEVLSLHFRQDDNFSGKYFGWGLDTPDWQGPESIELEAFPDMQCECSDGLGESE
ncbi:hypothetical protein BDN67DRAFT_964078 [Paxillus ammoniavirescens]|nr:hypothetical protein BDN67DRAFT_964078 [Paxillus ammoniavirescens]